ncbi:ubiquitin-like protein 3 [Penaeus japonicus]|uniref:ubiquitin-like protein 3 n=1 Tax=Penaeus japonicus TaxID=27405 RepID=UPI001C70BDDF|nr:ubiquitin-like protein 3 [Penaeus japonicus]
MRIGSSKKRCILAPFHSIELQHGRRCISSFVSACCTVPDSLLHTDLFRLFFQINLRLILVSGKTKEFLFSPSESAGDIAQFVFDNWPEEWADESVSKAEILRLIYQGRFLHGNVTLGALGLPTGKTCVMHLVPRENLPEPNSQDQRQKSKGGTSSCCSASCAIL